MTKFTIPLVFFVLCYTSIFAQIIDKVISATEVERIERALSADDMQGRETFTPGADRAADFIAAEFRKAGVLPLKSDSYFQEFEFQRRVFGNASVSLNGSAVTDKNVIAFSSKPDFTVNENSGYERIVVGPKDTLFPVVQRLIGSKSNAIVFVDTVHARLFNGLRKFRRESMPLENSVVFILTSLQPTSFSVDYHQTITPLRLRNVVGMIPGKKRKDEYVIYSAHYDHLGIKKANAEGDSIFNGANDDAAGVTAVIMLANYFNQIKNNERSIIVAAFTAEEIGGYGSQYFSQQLDPKKVMAMFNVEMIGTESKWGKNSAFITGYEQTDMGAIMQKNLQGSAFTFHPDPYPEQQLFYRSDNATLAKLGVPAHTISTSKMDVEKFYHTQDDEIETLDIANMTEIIKAIAISSQSIVSGKDTPSRVNTGKLRK
jgi:hypothetical protein